MIPFPRNYERREGELKLTEGGRIVVADDALAPLANVVATELELLAAIRLPVVPGTPRAGDVGLTLDDSLAGEQNVVDVGDFAAVRGGTYPALADGTVTLLQMLGDRAKLGVLPRGCAKDEPALPFRGLMVDLARQWHEVETLRKLIILCRWYKIRTLHLHLTDDQSFTFPSTAYPQLATPGRSYTLEQLRDLEAFASERGVTLLPELDVPGHSTALNQALPSLVACDPPGVHDICPGRESTYEVLQTLIREMCDVFRTTPHFHIGADECQAKAWPACAHCRSYREKHGLDDEHELYRHFLVRANDIVKRCGKRTIAWEGFRREGKVHIPRDIAIMEFESYYCLPQHLLEDGFEVINTSWRPLYVCNDSLRWPARTIHRWNHLRWESPWPISGAYGPGITVDPTPAVLGAEMCSWGQCNAAELPSLRERLATMSERIWNPDGGRSFDDLSVRMERAELQLSRLFISLQPRERWYPWVTNPERE